MIAQIISMFQSLATALATLFLSARAVGVAALISGTLAGLFGYQFLGKTQGVLRQFLIGLPAGVIFGLLTYSFDFQAHFAYSEGLQALLAIPAGPLSHYLFGLVGFTGAMLEALANPNNFRSSPIELSRVRQVLIVALFASDVALSTYVIVKVNAVKLGLPIGNDVLTPASAAVSLTLGLAAGLSTAFLDAIRARIDGSSVSSKPFYSRLLWSAWLLAFLMVVTGLGVVYFSYVIVLLGWGVLAYLVFVAIGFAMLYFTQRYVDSLKDEQLIYFSFGFFLIAVGLQFYQVLAF